MQKITFRECTLAFLEKTFGLSQTQKNKSLKNWMSVNYTLSEFEKQYLLSLQEKLLLNVIHWNEQELLANFIVPLFTLVNFTTKKFNDFAERNIKAVIGEYELSGNPDGIVATGFREPEIPYFAFHEYKPYSDPTGEPTGQCLAAMLVGQTLNKTNQTVYGCYVIGKEWNFMLLQGKEYAISKAYLVDDEEVFEVFRIVQGLKQILLKTIV